MSFLRFSHVNKSYRSGFALRKVPVLHDVSFELSPGEVFGYLGHNGAGKSTSVKAMLGLIGVDGGSIELFGARPGSRTSLRRIGYLPENPYFYDHLTGEEFLQLVAGLCELKHADRRRRIDEVLERVGMGKHSRQRLRSYSKGMLQRIGLAQAILNDPELLILDEPMGGLDPVGRAQMRQIIEELAASGKTIFLCSHILADVEAVADRAAILSGGRLRRVVDLRQLRVEGREIFAVVRGLADGAVEEIRSQGHRVELHGETHHIFLSDQSELARVISFVDSSGARLLNVHPVRRSLEEIFLSEVAQAKPGDGPDDVHRAVSSVVDAVDESTKPVPAERENDYVEASK